MSRLTAILIAVIVFTGCAGSGPRRYDDYPLSNRQRDAAMKALLGEDQYLEYVLLTDTAEAAEWLRQFWIKHDPTPTTAENEFEAEHRRRVYHAIYFFGNPSKSGPPWDERGEVYIRYGEPNERRILQHGLDDDPARRFERDRARRYTFGGGAADDALSDGKATTEVWTYYSYNQTFQFEDDQGWGFFEMVPVTDPEYRRQDLSDYFETKMRAIDLQPAIYYHEYGKNLIDYALDVVRFHTGDNKWCVDVNLGYPLAELGRGPDSMTISLRRTIVLRDKDQNDVYSETGLIHRRTDSSRTRERLMVEQKILDLASGNYELAVKIEDLFTGKAGTYTKSIKLPKHIVAEVHEISDVELASFVWTIYEPGSPFVKDDRMVMPLPSRIYLPGQPLAFYYEVYNLLRDEKGATRYTVSYEIKEIGGDGLYEFDEPGEFSGGDRTARRFGSLDLHAVPPGDYLLTVLVDDRIGHHEKSTVVRFRKSG
jgi:GWxTD domain-containing protein